MFDDILNCDGCSGDCGGNCACEDDKCPNCGSENTATAAYSHGMRMYCSDCGHVWST